MANQAHSWRFEKHSHNTSEVRKFMLCFSKFIHMDVDNAAVLTVHLAHGGMLLFRVLPAKSAPTCKVLHLWVFFHETTVYHVCTV